MKIDVVEMTQTKAQFVISDTNPSFANALRRVITADVPKMPIDNVEFHLGPIMDEKGTAFESVSPLFDEMVAHRLGLIPIPTDLDAFNFRSKCTCNGEGCPNCTIMYSLNKKGPCTVYSGDLVPVGDAKFRIKDDLIPIVKLADDQALLIYATAELGTGKQHAKWQAALGAGYRYFAKIEIDHSKCDLGGSCVKVCPKGFLPNPPWSWRLVGDSTESALTPTATRRIVGSGTTARRCRLSTGPFPSPTNTPARFRGLWNT